MNDDGSCWGAHGLDGVDDFGECVAMIGLVVFPGTKLYKAAKALGGVYETAKLLWGGAFKKMDFVNGIPGALTEFIGIKEVQESCGFE